MSKSSKRLVSYVTPKEYRVAVKLAKLARRSVSDYIRMLVDDAHREHKVRSHAEGVES